MDRTGSGGKWPAKLTVSGQKPAQWCGMLVRAAWLLTMVPSPMRVFQHPDDTRRICFAYGPDDIFELVWTQKPSEHEDVLVWVLDQDEIEAVPDGWVELLPHPTTETTEDRVPHAHIQLDPTDRLSLRQMKPEPGQEGHRFEIMATELTGDSSAVIELTGEQLQAIRDLQPIEPPPGS